MTEAPPDDWTDRWFEFHRLFTGTREQRKALALGQPADVQAAHDWVQDRLLDGGLDAIAIIAELAEAASNEREQSEVGIGPIESLIYVHGDTVVPPLLDRARRSPALAEAVSWVLLASGSVSATSAAGLARYQRHH